MEGVAVAKRVDGFGGGIALIDGLGGDHRATIGVENDEEFDFFPIGDESNTLGDFTIQIIDVGFDCISSIFVATTYTLEEYPLELR